MRLPCGIHPEHSLDAIEQFAGVGALHKPLTLVLTFQSVRSKQPCYQGKWDGPYVRMVSQTSILATKADVTPAVDGGFLALAPEGAAVRVGAMGRTREDAEAAFARALDRAARAYREAGLIDP